MVVECGVRLPVGGTNRGGQRTRTFVFIAVSGANAGQANKACREYRLTDRCVRDQARKRPRQPCGGKRGPVFPWQPNAPTPPARAKPVPAPNQRPGAAVPRRANETNDCGMTEQAQTIWLMCSHCASLKARCLKAHKRTASSEPNQWRAGRQRTDGPRRWAVGDVQRADVQAASMSDGISDSEFRTVQKRPNV